MSNDFLKKDIDRLVIDLASNEDMYEHARKLVEERKSKKEKLLKLLDMLKISEHKVVFRNNEKLLEATYSVKIRSQKRLDTKNIPEQIKKEYTVETKYRYEQLTIKNIS
jgi:folylpolyglutamate synthase/dihydropteroate synthase